MTTEMFGKTEDGTDVSLVEIRGGGLTAKLMSWGATLLDLRLEGHGPSLVLGFPNFADYPAHSPYFGATPGRHANRIAHGQFRLDGKEYQLDRNQNGTHHLHGGSQGIGKRVWTIADRGADFVRFEIIDPDGHMGYPGTCRTACTYRLKEGGVLSVVHEAETDRPTLCNMVHHSYFNLDGGADILDHELMIAADRYLPVDTDQIPVGEVLPVVQTPFDFREMRPVRHAEGDGQFAYDHNYCLSDMRVTKRAVAQVRSLKSGIAMQVRTGEPGLQFYCGFKIATPVAGLDGQRYGACAGLCLESQIWPDSPNQNGFPSAVLRPGEQLHQATDYIFSRI
ncbi:MAG: galactose mutarotase [Hyphomicrobiales bacterium]|nr:galactose mutarotase [Hyphomicrobiales bacterium]MCP5001613.1 galactose mutarotase [Hyphomicrobiales bacterium]